MRKDKNLDKFTILLSFLAAADIADADSEVIIVWCVGHS